MSPEVSLPNIFLTLTERKGQKRLTSTEHAKGEIKQTILHKFKIIPLCYWEFPAAKKGYYVSR